MHTAIHTLETVSCRCYHVKIAGLQCTEAGKRGEPCGQGSEEVVLVQLAERPQCQQAHIQTKPACTGRIVQHRIKFTPQR